jgi:hypothetical protein
MTVDGCFAQVRHDVEILADKITKKAIAKAEDEAFETRLQVCTTPMGMDGAATEPTN